LALGRRGCEPRQARTEGLVLENDAWMRRSLGSGRWDSMSPLNTIKGARSYPAFVVR